LIHIHKGGTVLGSPFIFKKENYFDALLVVFPALRVGVFARGFATFAVDAAVALGGLPRRFVTFFAAKLSSITACAAASRETGTLKGEEET